MRVPVRPEPPRGLRRHLPGSAALTVQTALMGTGRARRRLADLALLLLAAGVVLLVGLALRPAQPETAVLSPVEASTPDRSSPSTTPSTTPSAEASPTSPVTAVSEGPPPATAALGDGLVDDDDGWYRVLVSTADTPVRDVLNAGVPGQTASQVAARVSAVLEARPQVVVVQAGTNDLLRGVPLATTVTALRGTVTRLQAADVVPVLVTVPPSDALAARVGPLNEALAALGAELSVPVIDPWADVRQADDSWVTGTSQDGVEPTAEASQQAAARARELLGAADLPTG